MRPSRQEDSVAAPASSQNLADLWSPVGPVSQLRSRQTYDVDSVAEEVGHDLRLVHGSLRALMELTRAHAANANSVTTNLLVNDVLASLAVQLIPLMRSLAFHTKNSIAATVHFKDDDMLHTLVQMMHLFAGIVEHFAATAQGLFGVDATSTSTSSGSTAQGSESSQSPLAGIVGPLDSISKQQLATCADLLQGLFFIPLHLFCHPLRTF